MRVTPRARSDAIAIDANHVLVRVTALPEDGKANRAVEALVARTLGRPASAVSVVTGDTARDKRLKISP